MTQRFIGVFAALLGCYLSNTRAYYSLEVGDPCPTRDYSSSCQLAEQCPSIGRFIDSGRLAVESVMNCGYSVTGEKVCCPLEEEGSTSLRFSSKGSSNIRSTTTTTTTTTTESPQWLSIFKTSREYVQRSIATSIPFSRDNIVFPDTNKRNGAACQTPLYEGKCLGISQCPSLEPLLKQRRLRDDDIQTCRPGTVEEIICCPINLPLQPRGQDDSGTRAGSQPDRSTTESPPQPAVESGFTQDQEDEDAVRRAALLLPHYKHLAALAYPNAAFDGHLHRCTALVLTAQLLLTVAGCGRPSHAVFGVPDMREVDVDEDYLVDIKHVAVQRQDLELLLLTPKLMLSPKLTLAPMCTHFELTRLQTSGQLIASAWAKGNESDCPFYEMPMRLLPFEACQDIENVAGVQNLPTSHLCVGPVHLDTLGANNASSCAPCPAVVGSVLHLRRPSGSRCVLGIATPTGDGCNAQAMYYTSVLDARLIDFVEQQLQQKQQQF